MADILEHASLHDDLVFLVQESFARARVFLKRQFELADIERCGYVVSLNLNEVVIKNANSDRFHFILDVDYPRHVNSMCLHDIRFRNRALSSLHRCQKKLKESEAYTLSDALIVLENM